MSKNIKYIGYYDLQNSKVKRNISLAATNKMDYICDSLISLGFNVHIVSPAYSIESNTKYNTKEHKNIASKKSLTSLPSFGSKNKFLLLINIILSSLSLLVWGIKNIKRNEIVIVYHSMWIAIPIILLCKLKRIKLVLEIEELYSDINKKGYFFRFTEKYIIRLANSYFLAAKELINLIEQNKKYIIINGQYRMKPKLAEKKIDGKIHLVYSGTIDSLTQSAFNAVKAGKFLDNNYILHIIGSGEIDELKKIINEVQRHTECYISYDGVKINEDYTKFIQSCTLGLNTRTTKGAFLSTSFPSKVLSYLSAGLNVVSSNISAVKDSPVGDLVSYYYEDSPVSIAKAIKNATIHPRSVLEKRINDLDQAFVKELEKLIINA